MMSPWLWVFAAFLFAILIYLEMRIQKKRKSPIDKPSLIALMILITGAILNFMVVAANGYYMPVDLNACDFCVMQPAEGSYHIMADIKQANLWWLSDIIRTPIGVMSIGDGFTFLGAFIYLTLSISSIVLMTINKRRRKNERCRRRRKGRR